MLQEVDSVLEQLALFWANSEVRRMRGGRQQYAGDAQLTLHDILISVYSSKYLHYDGKGEVAHRCSSRTLSQCCCGMQVYIRAIFVLPINSSVDSWTPSMGYRAPVSQGTR